MRDYLIAKYKEEKAAKKGKGKRKHKDETPEERKARKERKKLKKLKKQAGKSEAAKGVMDLLDEFEGISRHREKRPRSPSYEDDRRRPFSGEDLRGEDDYRRRPDRSPGRRRSPPPRSPPSSHRSRSPLRDTRHSRRDSPDRYHRRNHDNDVTPPHRRRDLL